MTARKPVWNWQQSDWPIFRYDASVLQEAEARFLHQSGLFQGALRHMDEAGKKALAIEVISTEACKTSEIEGEMLNRSSLQSSLRRNFGLGDDKARIPPAEQGIADMMTELYRGYDRPLDDAIVEDAADDNFVIEGKEVEDEMTRHPHIRCGAGTAEGNVEAAHLVADLGPASAAGPEGVRQDVPEGLPEQCVV